MPVPVRPDAGIPRKTIFPLLFVYTYAGSRSGRNRQYREGRRFSRIPVDKGYGQIYRILLYGKYPKDVHGGHSRQEKDRQPDRSRVFPDIEKPGYETGNKDGNKEKDYRQPPPVRRIGSQ